MSEVAAPVAVQEYPEINKLVLAELRKIPETVLGGPVLDNGSPEVRNIELAVHETLKVIENHLDLSFKDSDLIPVGEGPDIQMEKVMVQITVSNLATQYFDMVSN